MVMDETLPHLSMHHQLKIGDQTLMTVTLLQIWDLLLLLDLYDSFHYGQLAIDICFPMSSLSLRLYDCFLFGSVIPLGMESLSFLK